MLQAAVPCILRTFDRDIRKWLELLSLNVKSPLQIPPTSHQRWRLLLLLLLMLASSSAFVAQGRRTAARAVEGEELNAIKYPLLCLVTRHVLTCTMLRIVQNAPIVHGTR
jgi:hypothetical protein